LLTSIVQLLTECIFWTRPARQRSEFDATIATERAALEQRYAALKCELLAKIENELQTAAALRQELAAAHAELDRLRALQPAH
jgi:hypothetical protein